MNPLKPIADKHKISVRTLQKYVAEGIDAHDDDAMAKRVLRGRHKTGGADAVPDYEVSRSKWKAEQARKLKLEADKMAGLQVMKSVVKADMYRIGVMMRDALTRLEVELPPLLDGQETGAMARVIRDKTRELLEELQAEFAKLYSDAKQE
jgi:hypothetical protein